MKLLALSLFSAAITAFSQSLTPNEIIVKLAPFSSRLKAGDNPRYALHERIHAVLAHAGNYQVARALPETWPAEEGQFLLLRYEQPAIALAEVITKLPSFSEVEYAQFNHVFRCKNIPPLRGVRGVSTASTSSQGHSHASELNCNVLHCAVILKGTSLVLDSSLSAREGSSRMTMRGESQTNAQRASNEVAQGEATALNDTHVSANTPLAPLKGGMSSHDIPNDSLFSKQWALATLRATDAWQITAGARDVLVAVIDTGIELDHPDLQSNLWINSAEDLNRNQRLDEADFNHIDDDGNGFVDDVIGWDFTDAPNFPDGDDYMERDHDPSDRNGHGTTVAGVIAAVANNEIGVAGLAPNCRVMALRAGTSRGLLEEDDVASALVYAVMNGARVINMSFGDVVTSPMLRDVIRFAHRRGAVLVASAGNAATEDLYYPAGFAETISVGASTRSDRLAVFSSYGAQLDVIAPGEEIWTTIRGHSYAPVSGTSAAAPYVSALVALLISRAPDMSNEMVRAALHNSAVDLGQPGWDRIFGAGRIDALAALQIEHLARAEIQSPRMDAGISASTREVVVRGTALGAFVSEYELSYGAGNSPTEWRTINVAANRQVLDDSLAVWPAQNLSDGAYTLRLQVRHAHGASLEDKVRVFIDRTPPRVSSLRWQDMIDGEQHSVLIEFETDDVCQAALWWRARGPASNFTPIVLNYTTTRHRLNFTPQAQREVEFYITAQNQAGLETRADNREQYYHVQIEPATVNTLPLVELPLAASLPAGYALPFATDFDGDGNGELLLAPYEKNNPLRPLTIFERTPTGFAPHVVAAQALFPRDVGDSDRDGKLEILAGYGNRGFVYEATNSGAFPTQLVWADTNNFWAARFADLDHDGRSEIIGRTDDVFLVRENEDGNVYGEVAKLINFTRGNNLTGVPHAEIADFDGDGRQEILLGDSDGDIYIYEAAGDNQFAATWQDSLPLIDSIDYIRAGDFDGDGRTDFAAGCHSSLALNAEHEFDGRHWLFRMYRATGDNQFEVVWEQRFLGLQSPRDFDAGVGAGDIDHDGRDELFLNLFPDIYLVAYENGKAQVVWHEQTGQSNTTIVAALERSQPPAFYFSNGERVQAFSLPNNNTGAPAPQALAAKPLDESRVQLTWRAVSGAESYALYRGAQDSALSLLAQTTSTSYLDQQLTSEQVYRYAVATIVSQSGALSREVVARPSASPRVLSAHFLAPHFVAVAFTEPMQASVREPEHFDLHSAEGETGKSKPGSVVLSRSAGEALLSFPQAEFSPGRYTLTVANVFDANGVALDTAAAQAGFEVRAEPPRFYLTSAKLESSQDVLLQFNLALDPASAEDVSHYKLTTQPSFAAPLAFDRAEVPAPDPAFVRLHLSKGMIAPLGRGFVLTAQGVRSRAGIVLRRGEGDAIGFAPVSNDLKHVQVYPNPFVASRHTQLTIAGLTESATIAILDEQGRVLVKLQERNGDGGYHWDARNARGKALPSGVYACYITSEKETAWAKFVIVR